MGNYFKITKAEAEALTAQYETPLLVVSLAQIERNFTLLSTHLPGVKLHYAVKSNPDSRIIRKLVALGAYFDVASDGEMRALAALDIEAERMVYANPVKTAAGLRTASQVGVNRFTFDSESEIAKMAQAVPGGTVLLRVRIDNPRALVNLNEKFGAQPEEVPELLRQARAAGLDVAGLCFHVGSQSPGGEAYVDALKISRRLFDAAALDGFALRILDIGGGFPVPTRTEEIDAVPMADIVSAALNELFPGVEIWAEPGRYICSTAVNLLTRVIGAKLRSGQQWYFLDDGLYGTFSGIIFDHWDFELESFKTGKTIKAIFAGPSCDSFDVLFRDRSTVPLEVGDILLVPNCGAYTSASASEFNGFAKTPIVIWEEVAEFIKGQLQLADVG